MPRAGGCGKCYWRGAIGVSYSFTRARSAESGADPLDFLPAHRAQTWITVAPTATSAATLRGSYVARQIDRATTLPAYALLDLVASARLDRRWLLAVRCDDLLDRRRPIRSDVHAAGRVFAASLETEWD